MGESSKLPESWTFKTPFLKFEVYPLSIHNLKLKWSIVLGQTDNKTEAIMVSLIQHFERSPRGVVDKRYAL